MLGLGNSLSNIYVPQGGSSYSNTQALEFDATNEAVQINQNYSSVYAGSFSLNFWHKSGTHLSQYFWYLQSTDIIGINSNNGRALVVTFKSDGEQTAFTTDTGVVGSDGNWRNIGISIIKSATGSSATTIAVYVNGSAVNIASTSGSTTSTKHGNFSETVNQYIGRKHFSDGSFISSAAFSIDEVGLWNTNLTEANHNAIYNDGATIDLQEDSGDYNKSSNLQAYFRFEEGSGSSTANSIGPADVGTLLNSVSRVAGVDG